jgi:dTDP-4-amino-4,6-dideoxygalactose transaminase
MTADRTIINLARPLIGLEETANVLEVLKSGQLAQGPVVAELEARFAKWCGVRNAVAVTSGTTALHAALMAHGVGPGDEVITSPFTFIASASAALFVGARPVFVDVDPVTFCMDPDLLAAALTPRTRAIIPVHLFGHPAPMAAIHDIIDGRSIVIVEDACQAHGATIEGRKVGALGNTAVFSLYPTKNMTAGEGGFVTSDDDEFAARVRAIRSHGATEAYKHDVLGFNFRLSDLHAAVGLAQLEKLDAFNSIRRQNAGALTEGLTGVPGIQTPVQREGCGHVFNQYTVRISDSRDRVRKRLADRGIATAVYYPIPLHRQAVFATMLSRVSFPITEALCQEVLSLPVHPGLVDGDVQSIIDSTTAAVGTG